MRSVGIFSQEILVESQSYASIFLAQDETLSEHFLELIRGEEEQVRHLAHRDADRLNISQQSTLTVNVDDLDACHLQEVPSLSL